MNLGEAAAAWVPAVCLIALFVYFGVTEYQEDVQENRVRIECIKAGGTAGSKLGSPTCDMP